MQVELVETFLAEEISKRIPDFSMQEFTELLTLRKDELDGEVFDLLLTFSDFVALKNSYWTSERTKRAGRWILATGSR
ncbi:hypothetical protein ACOMHN_010358 [Nucella lapillus]